MRVEKRLSITDSCKKIEEMIVRNNPFSITRVGLGGETAVSAYVLNNIKPPENILNWLYLNAGFYGSNDYYSYGKLYQSACTNSDLHAYWNFPGFIEMEDFLVPENKTLIDPGSLESFRVSDPWTKQLVGKRILIVHPFKDSILSQLKKRESIWKNQFILPEANYIVYKSVQSIGGKGPHSSWFESFEIMCNDISKIDFDIAFLSCGSYGLPLVDFIKTKLNKSAIYIGGGLQLYFGILGKRWEQDDIKVHYNEHWIRPSPDEKPNDGHLVEGGCYW